MIKGMNIAVIPARGGSKRIPRKNIRLFAGRPIISWVIDELMNSGVFTSVYVSTEDDEIAAISESAGAKVTFRRSDDLADDFATTGSVMTHAIETIISQLNDLSLSFCTVYPTAVFADRGDYSESFRMYNELDDGFVFSVGQYDAPIERSFSLENGVLTRFDDSSRLQRTQDLPTRYFDAGQFYWSSANMWKKWESGIYQPSAVHILPKWKVHDIDTQEDWDLAEQIFIARVMPKLNL